MIPEYALNWKEIFAIDNKIWDERLKRRKDEETSPTAVLNGSRPHSIRLNGPLRKSIRTYLYLIFWHWVFRRRRFFFCQRATAKQPDIARHGTTISPAAPSNGRLEKKKKRIPFVEEKFYCRFTGYHIFISMSCAILGPELRSASRS